MELLFCSEGFAVVSQLKRDLLLDELADGNTGGGPANTEARSIVDNLKLAEDDFYIIKKIQ